MSLHNYISIHESPRQYNRNLKGIMPDMRFFKNFTPPDFQPEKLTPLFSPNFKSFGDKNTKKMSGNGDI